MSLTKKILRNFNILNAILILGIILFILKVLMPSYKVDVIPVVNTVNQRANEIKIEDTTKQESPPSMDYYSIITENNLFHPDRKFVVQKPEEILPKPEFVLYGTLIADDVRVAYMEDLKSPYTTTGRGKRQRSVHVGETVSGYTLSEIYSDKVIMVRGDDRIEVRVTDLSKGKRSKTEPPQPTPQKPKEIDNLKNRRPDAKPPRHEPPIPPNPQ